MTAQDRVRALFGGIFPTEVDVGGPARHHEAPSDAPDVSGADSHDRLERTRSVTFPEAAATPAVVPPSQSGDSSDEDEGALQAQKAEAKDRRGVAAVVAAYVRLTCRVHKQGMRKHLTPESGNIPMLSATPLARSMSNTPSTRPAESVMHNVFSALMDRRDSAKSSCAAAGDAPSEPNPDAWRELLSKKMKRFGSGLTPDAISASVGVVLERYATRDAAFAALPSLAQASGSHTDKVGLLRNCLQYLRVLQGGVFTLPRPLVQVARADDMVQFLEQASWHLLLCYLEGELDGRGAERGAQQDLAPDTRLKPSEVKFAKDVTMDAMARTYGAMYVRLHMRVLRECAAHSQAAVRSKLDATLSIIPDFLAQCVHHAVVTAFPSILVLPAAQGSTADPQSDANPGTGTAQLLNKMDLGEKRAKLFQDMCFRAFSARMLWEWVTGVSDTGFCFIPFWCRFPSPSSLGCAGDAPAAPAAQPQPPGRATPREGRLEDSKGRRSSTPAGSQAGMDSMQLVLSRVRNGRTVAETIMRLLDVQQHFLDEEWQGLVRPTPLRQPSDAHTVFGSLRIKRPGDVEPDSDPQAPLPLLGDRRGPRFSTASSSGSSAESEAATQPLASSVAERTVVLPAQPSPPQQSVRARITRTHEGAPAMRRRQSSCRKVSVDSVAVGGNGSGSTDPGITDDEIASLCAHVGARLSSTSAASPYLQSQSANLKNKENYKRTNEIRKLLSSTQTHRTAGGAPARAEEDREDDGSRATRSEGRLEAAPEVPALSSGVSKWFEVGGRTVRKRYRPSEGGAVQDKTDRPSIDNLGWCLGISHERDGYEEAMRKGKPTDFSLLTRSPLLTRFLEMQDVHLPSCKTAQPDLRRNMMLWLKRSNDTDPSSAAVYEDSVSHLKTFAHIMSAMSVLSDDSAGRSSASASSALPSNATPAEAFSSLVDGTVASFYQQAREVHLRFSKKQVASDTQERHRLRRANRHSQERLQRQVQELHDQHRDASRGLTRLLHKGDALSLCGQVPGKRRRKASTHRQRAGLALRAMQHANPPVLQRTLLDSSDDDSEGNGSEAALENERVYRSTVGGGREHSSSAESRMRGLVPSPAEEWRSESGHLLSGQACALPPLCPLSPQDLAAKGVHSLSPKCLALSPPSPEQGAFLPAPPCAPALKSYKRVSHRSRARIGSSHSTVTPLPGITGSCVV